MTERSVLEFALAYAARGWPVLPVVPGGKRPLNGHGIEHATTDAETLREWFGADPDAGIGIRLDKAGLIAIDFDPRNGGALEMADDMPPTLTADTGGGGLHLLYKVPAGSDVPGSMGPGVDIKHHGYIVVEPSIHPSGRRYVWRDFDPLDEGDVEIADAPAGLFKATGAASGHAGPEAGDGKTLEGGRNERLSREGFRLRRQGLSVGQITLVLLALNEATCDPPLERDEVEAIALGKAAVQPEQTGAPGPINIFRTVVAPGLDSAVFPPLLRMFAGAMAAAAGHDPSLYLMAALAAVAGALDDGVAVAVDPRTGWFESARLWVLLLGGPGTAKTPEPPRILRRLLRLRMEPP